jgi:hypothetical protein
MTWPEEQVSSAEVREWIQSQTPDCVRVDGPTVVYRVNGWGVTARFAVRQSLSKAAASTVCDHSVVCKIAYSPEDAPAPLMHRLLRACAAEHVPELLAWQARGSQTWLLFAAFEGRLIQELGAIEPVIEMARTLARIQQCVATLPPAETAGLLRLPVEQVPSLFEELLRRIREEGLCSRARDPVTLYEALAPFRDHVAGWAQELSAGSWPMSIDHYDLSTNNAVLLGNGRVLIYDWEGATLSCPLFSMDLFLESLRWSDRGPDAPQSIRQESGLAYTPSQIVVRRAYLEEWPWGTLAERERAFDVAMCLSQVQRAYQHVLAFEWLGSDFLASPEGDIEKHSMVAHFLEQAMRRWAVMLQPGA